MSKRKYKDKIKRIASSILEVWLGQLDIMHIHGGLPFIGYILEIKKELKERKEEVRSLK